MSEEKHDIDPCEGKTAEEIIEYYKRRGEKMSETYDLLCEMAFNDKFTKVETRKFEVINEKIEKLFESTNHRLKTAEQKQRDVENRKKIAEKISGMSEEELEEFLKK